MTTPLSLIQLMKWNGTAITEHNRKPLSIDVERIERKSRMVNGTMRKYVVADKHTFSTSWDMLPKAALKTVDAKWGGYDIEKFYNAQKGSFTLTVTDISLGAGEASLSTDYTVMFSNFSKEITKRGVLDFWTISVTMEEV